MKKNINHDESKNSTNDLEDIEALFNPMIRAIKDRISLKLVILFGSRAKGTAHRYSDHDILIVAEFEMKDFINRAAWVRNLGPRISMDLFCYTPAEFERMFFDFRLTPIDAIGEGIVLYDDDFVEYYKKKYEEFIDRGMKKSSCALIPPTL